MSAYSCPDPDCHITTQHCHGTGVVMPCYCTEHYRCCSCHNDSIQTPPERVIGVLVPESRLIAAEEALTTALAHNRELWKSYGIQQTAAAEAEARAAALAEENERMKTAGIIEVSLLNPNVASYAEEWEGRALKAEARAAAAEERERAALRERDEAQNDACRYYLVAKERDAALASEARARGEAERMAALLTEARWLIAQGRGWEKDSRQDQWETRRTAWLSRWQVPAAPAPKEPSDV